MKIIKAYKELLSHEEFYKCLKEGFNDEYYFDADAFAKEANKIIISRLTKLEKKVKIFEDQFNNSIICAIKEGQTNV